MFKEKDLVQYQNPLRHNDGAAVTLAVIRSLLEEKANEYQIQMEFYMDQIKTGGLLSSGAIDCLVLCHPIHKNNYYKWVIHIKRQGTMAFIYVDTCGTSKNSLKLNMRGGAGNALKDAWKNAGKPGNWSPGMTLVGGAGKALLGGLSSLGGSKAKAQEEELWYGAVAGIISEVIY